MTTEEEVRQENESLRERVPLQQSLLVQQQTLLKQQDAWIEGLHKQVGLLEEQVQALQERRKKDSHNSHLLPSSDRFYRQPKSLRTKSGKQPGYHIDFCAMMCSEKALIPGQA